MTIICRLQLCTIYLPVLSKGKNEAHSPSSSSSSSSSSSFSSSSPPPPPQSPSTGTEVVLFQRRPGLTGSGQISREDVPGERECLYALLQKEASTAANIGFVIQYNYPTLSLYDSKSYTGEGGDAVGRIPEWLRCKIDEENAKLEEEKWVMSYVRILLSLTAH